MFKKGDRVRINPDTINRALDDTYAPYVGERVTEYENLIVHGYGRSSPSFGKRVYVTRRDLLYNFYVYEKDLIRNTQRIKHIEQNYHV